MWLICLLSVWLAISGYCILIVSFKYDSMVITTNDFIDKKVGSITDHTEINGLKRTFSIVMNASSHNGIIT